MNKANFHDITGQEFGKWKVLRREGTAWKVSTYLCQCACGKKHIVTRSRLIRGKSKQCRDCGRKVAARARSLPAGDAARNVVLMTYKRHAEDRALPWQIDEALFTAVIQLPCVYCGSVPNTRCQRAHFNGAFVYSGLDRRDNTKGYTPENIVPCCKQCNWWKGNLPESVFLNHAKKIANQQALTETI